MTQSSFDFVITEFYKTKAGLENQWKHGKEMAEAKGEDFTLGQMDALRRRVCKLPLFNLSSCQGKYQLVWQTWYRLRCASFIDTRL